VRFFKKETYYSRKSKQTVAYIAFTCLPVCRCCDQSERSRSCSPRIHSTDGEANSDRCDMHAKTGRHKI